MDLSKVGEKLLSSVRSARSLPFLPPASDRPEVPPRAVAAAVVARALAGLPPHQRLSLPSNSEELVSIYGQRPRGQVIEELEEEFYEEDFDPVRYVLEHIPSEEDDLTFFEKKATVRLTQLDVIAERLSRHVMEHHEEMVKGMQLVMEVEQDLRVANVICMNGRRHLASATHEVSRDLVVTSSAKKKQALLDMLPILTEIRHAIDMRMALELLVEDGNYFKAFRVLSEYLQVLETFSELSAVQEMSRGVEVWLAKALQKLDSLLLSVCQEFRPDNYITIFRLSWVFHTNTLLWRKARLARFPDQGGHFSLTFCCGVMPPTLDGLQVVDAYALIGDISGLAEKIQSFFMQEVLSKTHSVLKDIIEKDAGPHIIQRSRLTYSDLCLQIPESKFRQCLLTTLDILFKLMFSYYEVLSFQPEKKESDVQVSKDKQKQNDTSNNSTSGEGMVMEATCSSDHADELSDSDTSTSYSPFDVLRNDAIAFVAQTLQRGRKNLWQLTTSRVSVLLSSSAVCSTSTHHFLRNYEDLNVFILGGEAFCGVEATEFRQKLKAVCESYFTAFHRQNIYAFKMVLEKETWLKISPETIQVIGLAGLLGDGAPIIAPSNGTDTKISVLPSRKLSDSGEMCSQKNGFAQWLKLGNPFSSKLTCASNESPDHPLLINGTMGSCVIDGKQIDVPLNNCHSIKAVIGSHMNGNSPVDDENEDLLADFIDEDSQLPSRISRPQNVRNQSIHSNNGDITAYTGSSLCLLRLMDKYARLMQKLEIVNVEFFKGICQLFELFFHFIYETFGQRETCLSVQGPQDSLTLRLKTALSRITQDCDQWIKPQTVSSTGSSPTSSTSFTHMDVTPTSSSLTPNTSFGLKERCAGAETLSLVAQMLQRSKTHILSMLLQSNTAMVEDFYTTMVDTVPDLVEHIHRTTAKILLHINGYVDRIANAKWELKDLGLEHNGYVDLLLGEFKHYKTRLAHSGIQKEVQDLLIEYGLENVAEVLVEGLSRVKRCTDEGRALMSLDLQVLINGLQHFVSINVKPTMQVVDTFVKAYYLPETEYVHWARSHPEYTKNQIIGLVNLVAAMKSWKRKTRLEVLERIETGNM